MKSTEIISSRRKALTIAAYICVMVAAIVGCTSRRQYAINESILISERRQLEDEIYRVQFELRDVLLENEQLRAELEKRDGGGSSVKGLQRRQSPSIQAPFGQRPTTTDEGFFPGGDALRTGANNATSSSHYPEYSALDTKKGTNLPDFILLPDYTSNLKKSNSAQVNAARQVAHIVPVAPPTNTSHATGISQPVYSHETDRNQEAVNEENNELYDEENISARAHRADLDDWSPLPR